MVLHYLISPWTFLSRGCELICVMANQYRYVTFLVYMPTGYNEFTGSQHMQCFPPPQVCCYNNYTTALFTSGPWIGYTLSMYNPTTTLGDVAAKTACCGDGDTRLCDLFTAKRPSDSCENYEAPNSGE